MPTEALRKKAQQLDSEDPLAGFRSRFEWPQPKGVPAIYFTGNSLGLMPTDARKAIHEELDLWASFGVEGHFEGPHPWYSYHLDLKPGLAELCGALEEEVTPMASLTQNLHFLLANFYRPQGKRTKILCEGSSFPSDFYMLDSQVRWHNLSPEQEIIELHPRKGETHLRTQDILDQIEGLGEELALVLMGGVNYLTGQRFQMQEITEAGHRAGAIVGFDLAHAMGNVPLMLHDWKVDFAAWCTYKYLNSGPGATAGLFVHKKHHGNTPYRLEGWWSNKANNRFQMERKIDPEPSADGWQLSNAPVMNMAAQRVSLALFQEAGLENLHKKREALNLFLLENLEALKALFPNEGLGTLTPNELNHRGCQTSLVCGEKGRALFEFLESNHVVADWRWPNVIRVAPVPLYNSFSDIWSFFDITQRFFVSS